MKNVTFWNRWIVLNLLVAALTIGSIYYLGGIWALLYLGLSTFFALGLHPLGGRWIQEHYLTNAPQETYSYYGPLNKVTFNMGFHNEHHDLMMVPWVNLPKLKKMAPEYYDSLHAYRSWTKVLFNFIFNPDMSPYSRIVHPDTSQKRRQRLASAQQQKRLNGEEVHTLASSTNALNA